MLTFAARSEISIVISFPSSSFRGFMRITVARDDAEVENDRRVGGDLIGFDGMRGCMIKGSA